MSKTPLYMDILITSSAQPNLGTVDNCSAVDITSDQSVEQFYAIVKELTKLIPWRDFDTIKITKNIHRLECTITLVETDVCEIVLKFKKLDNDNFDGLKFSVCNTFQPDVDSAAYWLKCMLT